MSNKDLIEKALYWADVGIPVFPCNDNKQPLTKNGFKDAETDPNKVKDLFEFYGSAATMIGGRMGEEAGIFAVDIDLYKGDAPEAWYKARVDDGSLPETRVHRTMRGGLHLLYSSDTTFPTTKPCEGVEVKGEGGYIILPGSPGYTVVQEGLRAAPKQLIEALRHSVKDRKLTSNDKLEAAILSGADFHDSLNQLAARKSASGKTMLEVQVYLKSLMDASMASNPAHDRHARWRAVVEDKGGEFSRIVSSGHGKFGTTSIDDELEHHPSMDEMFDAMGEVFYPKLSPQEQEILSPTGETWPYEGQGYFAHEDYDVTEQSFVLYPIFAEDETVVMYAEPKTGKTAVALSTALHIACGIDYGGFQVALPGTCLYYAFEGTRAIRLRVSAWRKNMLDKGVDLPADIPMFTIERASTLFKAENRVAAANQIIAANKYSIKNKGGPLRAVYIDTLTKAMSGGDQNSAEDTAQFFEITNLIRAGGVTATVVFIHHKARAGGNARGSSNIEAEPDVLLDVSKENDTVSMKIARARSIEDGATFYFKLSGVPLGKTKQGHPVAGVVAEPISNTSPVDVDPNEFSAVERQASMLKSLTELGVATHSAKSAVMRLHSDGYLPGAKKAPSASNVAAQKLLTDLVPKEGRVFGNYAIQLQKAGDAVTHVTVKRLST